MSASCRWNVLLVVFVLAIGMAVPVRVQQAPTPVITSVQPDLTKGTLKIDGASFPANPEVFLSTLPLTVFMATSSEIQTDLPADIAQATYLLNVRGAGKNGAYATFVVTIGAVGPQGPPGENGPQGPRPGRSAGAGWTSRSAGTGRTSRSAGAGGTRRTTRAPGPCGSGRIQRHA
jgi:hypothetical protein